MYIDVNHACSTFFISNIVDQVSNELSLKMWYDKDKYSDTVKSELNFKTSFKNLKLQLMEGFHC